MAKEKIHYLRVSERNLYLLHEAVECLIFAIERLANEHGKETRSDLQPALEHVGKVMKLIRRVQKKSTPPI